MVKREEEKNSTRDFAKLAAATGITYLGYRNRGAIARGIRETLSKSTVSLARVTESKTFKGAIGEFKNMSRAAVETYGSQTPARMLKNMMSTSDRDALLKKRLDSYNKALVQRARGTAPKDVAKTQQMLSTLDSNAEQYATIETALQQVKQLAEKNRNKYKEFFGDDVQAVAQVFKENIGLVLHEAGKDGFGGGDELNLAFQKAMLENNHKLAKNKTNVLHFDPNNAKEVETFYLGMMQYAKDVRSSMKGAESSGFKNAYRAAAFHADRGHRLPGKMRPLSAALEKQGLVPLTMGDATEYFVKEENGRQFLTKEAGKDRRFVQDYYSEPTRILAESKYTGQSTFTAESAVAERYIETGKQFGLDEEALKKDRFSHSLFMNPKTNEIINTAAIQENIDGIGDYIQENLQVPFLRMNPLDMTQRHSRMLKRNAESFYVHPAGSPMPFLDQTKLALEKDAVYMRNQNSVVRPTSRSYLQVQDKLIDSLIAKEMQGKSPKESYAIFEKMMGNYTAEEGLSLVNMRSGIYKAHAEGLSGYTNVELEDQGGAIKRLFGLGQEEESLFGRIKRGVQKFGEEEYAENLSDVLLARIEQEGAMGHSASSALIPERSPEYLIDRGYAKLYSNTRNMSDDAANMSYDVLGKALSERLHEDISLWDINSDAGVLEMAEKLFNKAGDLYQRPGKASVKTMQNAVLGEISQTFQYDYLPEQSDFLSRVRYLKDRDILTADTFSEFVEKEERGVRAIDDLKRLIEEYGILVAEEKGIPIKNLVANSLESGTFTKAGQEELNSLRALGQWTYFQKQAQSTTSLERLAENREALYDFYVSNPKDLDGLNLAFRKADPALGSGVGEKMDNLLGKVSHTPIKQHRTLLESINQSWVDMAEVQGDNTDALSESFAIVNGMFQYSKQLPQLLSGPGDNISTLTTGGFFFANRLNTPLEKLGLGLPNRLKSSAPSILFNQWGRRIVLPYMAYQTAKYVDGLTGDFFSDTAADTYVNMHADTNRFKEITGLNDLGRGWERMVPWQEQIDEWLPVKAFNAATFGMFSDFRSGEEVEEDYATGETAVRKGRYWGIGSTSPWFGNKIDRYEPNWYRKIKSDYQFSENMYGSESEYWANNWMPTLTHPLAPLNHFVLDPYHYEKKHALSRPYAITGGFAELDNIPLIGPAIDSVVSGVLKPQITNPRLAKAHRDYLSMYNERLTAAYINMNAGGAVNIGPSGSMVLSSDMFDVNFRDEDGNLDEEALVADEMRYNAERDRMAISIMNDTGIVPTLAANPATAVPTEQMDALRATYGENGVAGVGIAAGNGKASGLARYMLGQMNQKLTDSKTTNRSDQVSQAGTLADPNAYFGIRDAVNQNALLDPNGVARDIAYNAGEFGGMYGFLSKTAFGFEESGRGTTLESSERFSSYNNFFWEKEFGGLGGDLSEIGRRYLPRDPNKDYYNPIRNTMPAWLDLLVSINSLNCWKPLT